jgi:hypothetical protein
MSNLPQRSGKQVDEPEDQPKSPNIALIYALLAFGLLAAIAIAAFIVWPFYVRR